MKHFTLATLLALFFIVPMLQSQPRRDGRREAKERLNLTAEQEKAMKDIRVESATKLIDIRADIAKKRLVLGKILNDDMPDRATAERGMKEITDLQQQMKMILFDADMSVRKLLTAEQRQIYKELKEMKRDGRRSGNNHGKRHGGHDGDGRRRGGK